MARPHSYDLLTGRPRVTNRRWLLALLLLLVASSGAFAWQRGLSVRRASPPKWSRADLDVFFPDANTQLVGERPGRLAPQVAETAVTTGTPADLEPRGPFAWSQVISVEALEDEVKTISNELGTIVTTPSDFKGGGYKASRWAFSELAVLMAIVGQHDGRVRWREEAPAATELFARAGFNSKVGTDQSYAEARRRREDLEQLIRGERLQDAVTDGRRGWPTISDRASLMRRMETASQERISPSLANAEQFERAIPSLNHEAQILAALTEVIGDEEYDFADEPTYQEYIAELRSAARGLREAGDRRDYMLARESAAAIGKSCTGCHMDFRD